MPDSLIPPKGTTIDDIATSFNILIYLSYTCLESNYSHKYIEQVHNSYHISLPLLDFQI